MVAIATIGAGVLGAGASIFGANTAADAQAKAAQQASDTQMNMFNQQKSLLSPYVAQGNAANDALSSQLPDLTSPIKMDEATLQQTPGYQFNLSQGLKSVQNSAAARGLGVSGAALKGAASYSTGLADSTYQNQFNNAWTNKTNSYNMLMGPAQLGENAAAQTGSYGTQIAGAQANNLIGAGNAQASADMAIGKSIGGIGSSVGNLYLTNALMQNNGGKGLF